MNVRSPALAALGIALMASAATLGALLVHDGEVATETDLAGAAPGEPVRIKGNPEPFTPGTPLRSWRMVLPMLDNFTYTLSDPESGILALLTSPAPAPDGVVLADGTVGYVAPHPDGSGRLLVVIDVRDWHEPILFR
ncbi:MAG TPA: hypothetical protein VM327_02290 [Candidatus Thermoplasmatota archaeon]|nr:hypothetical protein [Candidatus Thermoplasmatota archaeon]